MGCLTQQAKIDVRVFSADGEMNPHWDVDALFVEDGRLIIRTLNEAGGIAKEFSYAAGNWHSYSATPSE
jgi:hypothetical protein